MPRTRPCIYAYIILPSVLYTSNIGMEVIKNIFCNSVKFSERISLLILKKILLNYKDPHFLKNSTFYGELYRRGNRLICMYSWFKDLQLQIYNSNIYIYIYIYNYKKSIKVLMIKIIMAMIIIMVIIQMVVCRFREVLCSDSKNTFFS